MAKKVRKFADGGSERYKARMDRKTADIEKDYKIALAKGKNADVAKAKYEQRMADAKDDFAKWTKADRTVTRAGESAAEAALKEARRTNGRSIQMRDTLEKVNKPLEPKVDVASTLKSVDTGPKKTPSFGEAFRAARAAGDKTFTWNGKSYAAKMAGEGAKKPAPKTATKPASSSPLGDFYLNQYPKIKGNAAGIKGVSIAESAAAQTKAGKSNLPATPVRATSKRDERFAPAASSGTRSQRDERFAPKVPAGTRSEDTRTRPLLLVGDEARKANKGTIGGMKKGGKVAPKKMAKGGSVDGCAIRGKTRAPMKKGK